MMKVELYHSAFEDTPKFVASFPVDLEDHMSAAEAVYSYTQNKTKEGWAKGYGLRDDHRSTSVGDYVEVEGLDASRRFKRMRYYVANMGFTRKKVNSLGREVA
tara:strand:+ start:6231 stop:6539 length:309 start_codon:yes stop_codon:yes gene_type:complete